MQGLQIIEQNTTTDFTHHVKCR